MSTYKNGTAYTCTAYMVLDAFLSALIYGDTSGLTASEAEQLDAFEKAETAGLRNWHWAYNTDHTDEFGRCEITGLRGALVELHLVNMDKELSK